MKKILSAIIIYISFALVFHFAAYGTVQIQQNVSQQLDVQLEILSVTQTDGIYTINYKASVSNPIDFEVSSLKIVNNLDAFFGAYDYSIDVISSDVFTLNNQFNGNTDTELLSGNNKLLPGETGHIYMTLSFTPGSNTGPFYNKISANGVYQIPPTDGTGTTSDGNDDGAGGNNDGSTDSNDGNDGGAGNGGGSGGGSDVSESDPETNLEPRTLQYILVDADNDIEIMEIHDGDVIDLDVLSVGNITIKVKVNPGTQGSVRFDLNGQVRYKVENELQYVLSGNNGSNYHPWDYEVGLQQLTTNLFTEKGAKGTNFYNETITFTLIEQQDQSGGEGEANGEDEIGFEITPEEQEEVPEEIPTETGETPPVEEEATETEEVPIDTEIVSENNSNTSSNSTDSETVTDTEVTTPIYYEDVGVSYLEIPNVSSSTEGGNILVETGISLNDSVLFGMFLLLGVMELNLFGIEYKSFSHFVTYIRNRNKNQSSLH